MSELTCSCPHCGQELNVESDFAGQAVACPACNGEFAVPDAPHAPTPVLPNAPAHAPGPKLNFPGAAAQQPQAPPQYQQPPYQQPPAPAYQQPQPVPYQQQPPMQVPPQMPGVAGLGPAYPGYIVGGGIGNALGDPLDGQPRAIQGLGSGGTLGWGLAFCCAWVIAAWLLAWRSGSAFSDAIGGVTGMSGGRFGGKVKAEHFEWIMGAMLPILVLILVLFLLRAIAGKQTSFNAIVFTSGMITVPVTGLMLFLLSVSYMKITSLGAMETLGHISIVVMLFVFSAVVLLTKASLVSVIGFTGKAAFWLVPSVLVTVFYVTGWLSKLLD